MGVLRQERDEGVMRFAEAERKREEMRAALEKSDVMMRGWGREREAALNRWRVVCEENKRAFRVCDSQVCAPSLHNLPPISPPNHSP